MQKITVRGELREGENAAGGECCYQIFIYKNKVL
jgi:hypothetical protein